MAISICTANIKGGIGKTSSALAIADQLMLLGRRVLMVDADPQRNTTSVYRAETEGVATMYDIFDSRLEAKECIQHTEFGDIIANDVQLIDADTKVKQGASMFSYIKRSIASVENDYDYIIYDTPPHNGIILSNVLVACEWVIIPIECELFAIQGLTDFYETLEEVRQELNPNLKVLGILKVRYKPRQNLTRDLEETILPGYANMMNTHVFQTAIRESVKCKEANTARMRLSEYAPNCTTAQDYKELVDEIIKEVEK